jgi:peptidoglycan/xylan/chitin deacetylase (PgdA/CDA1 family)
MWPNQKISHFLINKNKSLLVIFILSLFLFIPMSYHNVYQINNNIVYAEETVIPILTYHNFTKDIGSSYSINIIEFEKQMNYLATHNYSVISLSELLKGLKNGPLPPKPVAITIDDGFKSTFTLAYPVLKKYNFPATLFIYTDFIEKNSNSLTWEEIKEMTENNLEIGSHTLSHCNLLQYKENENYKNYLARIKKEIFLSKEILENKIGGKVKFFAYPYGVYSPTIINLVIQANYEGILNANIMNNTLNTDPFSLNRQIIFGNNSFNSFIQILNQQPLHTSQIFPYDGIIESDQFVKIGAILEDNNYNVKTLSMKLGGAKVEFTFNPENNEISFTPFKPLIKKSYIINISALDKNSNYLRKKSWLITIK